MVVILMQGESQTSVIIRDRPCCIRRAAIFVFTVSVLSKHGILNFCVHICLRM